MIPHLTMLRIISKMSKWRSLWPPLFIPRWPPVKSTWFFIPDMSQAAWKTRKRHPTCLHCSIFREMVFDLQFDLQLSRKWPWFDLVQVKMVIWWQWNVKSSQTTRGCWIFKDLESITNFGGHGGQMEVKTWSDRNGDGIFEKYGQKQGCVQKRSPIG